MASQITAKASKVRNTGDSARGRTTLVLLGMRGLALGTAFLAQVVLARLLGAAGYGQFAAVLAAAVVVSFLLRFGGDTVLLRLFGQQGAAAAPADNRPILQFVHRTLAAATLLFALPLLTMVLVLDADNPTRLLAGYLLLVCALAALMALAAIAQMALRGVQRPIRSQLPDLLQRPLLVVLLALIWLGGARVTAADAVLALLLATSLTLMLAWLLLPAGLTGPCPPDAPGQRQLWLASMWPLAIWAALQIALRQTDVLVLAALVGPEATGTYAAASRVAELVMVGVMVVDVHGAAGLAERWQRRDRQALQDLLHQLARWALLIALGLGLVLAFAGPWVLGWFGPEFVAALVPLYVLVAFQILNAATGSVSLLLAMADQEKAGAWSSVLALLLTFSLLLLLVPDHAGLGAALATGFGLLFWKLLMVVVAWTRLGVSPLPYGGVPAWVARRWPVPGNSAAASVASSRVTP